MIRLLVAWWLLRNGYVWWAVPQFDPYTVWGKESQVCTSLQGDKCGCRRQRFKAFLKRHKKDRYGEYYTVIRDDGSGTVQYVFKLYASLDADIKNELARVTGSPCPHTKPTGWFKHVTGDAVH